MTPLEETTRNQIDAADPARSAFVMANAGSGKTRVLTNRVARLLLANTNPDKILCITFTKAAAAEMAERLFDVLGEWALADDETLNKALSDLEGVAAKNRGVDDLAKVRRLFARALETPGGLKIQTIHSFCEQVLKRFPLEAGAPPGFAIIEDSEATQLRNAALDRVAISASDDQSLSASFDRLARDRGEKALRDLLMSGAMKRLDVEAAKGRFDGTDGVIKAAAAELDIDPSETETNIKSAFIGTLAHGDLEHAMAALDASGGNPAKLALSIKRFFAQAAVDEKWTALTGLFLTGTRTPRKKMTTKATDSVDPTVGPYLIGIQEKFIAAFDGLKALAIYRHTEAYLHILEALIGAYSELKAASAALDFDDLIIGVEQLFKRTDSAWVMYKLDQGIDHVLVDEAQDTSPAQWAIIEALLKEITSGAGARETARSFFAVGDMNQSIYYFQGADAELFEEKEADLGKTLAAAGAYQNFDLAMSFRSAAPVLDFVDALFAIDGAADGLGQRGVPAHGLKREGEAGLVELWPLTPMPQQPDESPWDAPVDEPVGNHPVQALSAKIAHTIDDWLARNDVLQSQGRPIRPGDIMILVQSRGPLFDEVIRALATKGVPVAGADRLKLMEDPAVEDLLSYANSVLLSSDDLSLAEILKSPLFNFDDDNDLFQIAYYRGANQSLWSALLERGGENTKWKAAADEILKAREVGLRQGPYAFFSHILETGAPSGRHRFYKRLSEASRDAIDELLRQALNFENAHPRSLRAFVNWFMENAGEIKREMERAHDAVRVMTVHGAKGLQSEIVFLLDAHRGPNIRQIGPMIELTADSANATGRERLSLLTGAKADDVAVTEAGRAEMKRKAYDEYRRQLYVAATRAEDRLYICGIEQGNTRDPHDKQTIEKTWHALAGDAFDQLNGVHDGDAPFWPEGAAPLRQYQCEQTADMKTKEAAPLQPDVQTPSWLMKPAAPEAQPQRLAPSRLADDEEARAGAPDEAPAHSPIAGDKYFRGRTLHRLLELLPEIEAGKRREAADKLLARLAPDFSGAERASWRDEVLTVMDSPDFAATFGPGSRAEVSIAGAPKGAKHGLTVSGQIDRLVVTDDKILVIDYKTNRPPPKTVEEISPAYVAQMAAYRALLQEIYPDHQIESALLWTFEARLTPLPRIMLDHAFARYLAAG